MLRLNSTYLSSLETQSHVPAVIRHSYLVTTEFSAVLRIASTWTRVRLKSATAGSWSLDSLGTSWQLELADGCACETPFRGRYYSKPRQPRVNLSIRRLYRITAVRVTLTWHQYRKHHIGKVTDTDITSLRAGNITRSLTGTPP